MRVARIVKRRLSARDILNGSKSKRRKFRKSSVSYEWQDTVENRFHLYFFLVGHWHHADDCCRAHYQHTVGRSIFQSDSFAVLPRRGLRRLAKSDHAQPSAAVVRVGVLLGQQHTGHLFLSHRQSAAKCGRCDGTSGVAIGRDVFGCTTHLASGSFHRPAAGQTKPCPRSPTAAATGTQLRGVLATYQCANGWVSCSAGDNCRHTTGISRETRRSRRLWFLIRLFQCKWWHRQ